MTSARMQEPERRSNVVAFPRSSMPEVPTIPRAQFIEEFGQDYHAGQHVTFIGPTGKGKTTLAFQLLDRVISPDYPKALILAGKPPGRDHTMEEAARKLNLRVVSEWPPPPAFGDKKKRGWVLRPRQKMRDHDEDHAEMRKQFRSGILSAYRTKPDKPIITFVDEAYLVQYQLKLQKECDMALTRGAPVNAMWSLVQRGRYISIQCYDAPEHVFIFYDPDLSNQKRYAEIGGVDARELMAITKSLKTERVATGQTVSQCLYMRRAGPEFRIVDIH